ncbi:MAG: amino acid-binding protein [Bacteroidaceae bacterium]
MTIHQISIFLENKSGTLSQVLKSLKDANIQIVASTISDTVEFGIYRMICSEPMRAYKTLEKAGISVNLTDVFAIKLDNRPGCAADTIMTLRDAGISISYLYSFLLSNHGILVFRTNDPHKTTETILLNKLHVITEEELTELIDK